MESSKIATEQKTHPDRAGLSSEQRSAHRPKEPQATKGSTLEMGKMKMQLAGKTDFSNRLLKQRANRKTSVLRKPTNHS